MIDILNIFSNFSW